MIRHPRLHAGFLAFVLTACGAMGGSEDLGGAGADFTIVAFDPMDGAPTVPVSKTIEITFDTPIDPSSVSEGSLSADVPLFGSLTVDGAKLRLDPAGDLIAGTTYVFDLSPDITGLNGTSLGPVPPYGFKTAGIAPPPDTLPPSGPRPR